MAFGSWMKKFKEKYPNYKSNLLIKINNPHKIRKITNDDYKEFFK